MGRGKVNVRKRQVPRKLREELRGSLVDLSDLLKNHFKMKTVDIA